ncbi:MAG TPA: polymer-forming cytoskeletal protein [Acidimicrobiales bacterium]|nr:polymer-forming cytoskeletal protein [Acidimicrobiales bacterium]
MHTVSRPWLAVALLLAAVSLVVLADAPAAGAQADDEPRDNLIVITGRAEVREDEEFDTVFIADGPAVVDGTVQDAVIALNGDVLVQGTVEGDVTAFDGRIVIASGGRVEGDALSRKRPIVEQGGRLDGSWERWNPSAWSWTTTVFARLALWLAVSVSVLVLGMILWLLAPRMMTGAAGALQRRAGPVIGWGLLLTIGLPIAAVVAMVTLVGLPLGLGLLLALALIYGIGYTVGAWVLGRVVAPRAHPVVAFLAGLGILRVVALVPFVGGLTWFVAVVLGLGALAVAGWGARGEPEPRPAAEPAPPTVGPPAEGWPTAEPAAERPIADRPTAEPAAAGAEEATEPAPPPRPPG